MRTSRGEFTARGSVIFALDDVDGRRGYGEAAPWPGFGTESEAEALAALEEVARLLAGADVEPGDWPVAAGAQAQRGAGSASGGAGRALGSFRATCRALARRASRPRIASSPSPGVPVSPIARRCTKCR